MLTRSRAPKKWSCSEPVRWAAVSQCLFERQKRTCFISFCACFCYLWLSALILHIILACIVHYCNSLHYFQIAVQTRQSSSEGRPPKSLDVSSNASSQVMLLSNHMHGSRPAANLTNDKYLKAVLYAERQGVAALRSVADMLRKSAEDSIKSMVKYQSVIDEANKNSFWVCISLYMPVVFYILVENMPCNNF